MKGQVLADKKPLRQDPDIYVCPKCAIGVLHEVVIPGKKFNLIIRDCKVCFYTDRREAEVKENAI